MLRLRFTVVAAFAALCVPCPALAEGPDTRAPRLAYVEGGVEGDVEHVGLGYVRELAGATVDVPAALFVELRVETPSFRDPAYHGGRLRTGLRVELLRAGRFALPMRAELGLAVAVSPEDVRLLAETEAALLPGYYVERGAIAFEGALRSTWGRFTSSRDNGTSEWAHVNDHRLRVGLRGTVSISRRLQLVARAGYDDVRDLRHGAPTYSDLALGIRF